MSPYPMLEKLGVRVARMPRLLGGRAFVWQRDLGALRPGIECVVMEDIPVSPHLVKLFFHCGCFFDAVAKAEKGVKKTAVPK